VIRSTLFSSRFAHRSLSLVPQLGHLRQEYEKLKAEGHVVLPTRKKSKRYGTPDEMDKLAEKHTLKEHAEVRLDEERSDTSIPPTTKLTTLSVPPFNPRFSLSHYRSQLPPH